jgi:hypothetical protein
VSAPVIAAQARTRTATGAQAILAAAVLGLAVVIALGAIGAWISRSPAIDNAAVRGDHYGAGYPLHGGLAGPSRVGTGIQTVEGSRYGAGYPLHGGLAGPSRVATVMQTPEGNVFAWPNEIGDGS